MKDTVRKLEELERDLEMTRRALRKSREELEWECAVSQAMVELQKPLVLSHSTIREMAERVLDQSLRLTGSSIGYVSSVEIASGDVKRLANTDVHKVLPEEAGELPKMPARYEETGAFRGIRGHALNTGQAFFCNDAESHPMFSSPPAWHLKIERFLAVPIILNERPAGQIALANPPREYQEKDLEAVCRVATFFAAALQRKEAEEQTNAALREKEVLLREVHHRVKNNLQVVSSLLNLQARRVKDPAALEMLKESQHRVRSMALVHEQLHRSSNLSRIDFCEYIRNLTASLFSSYGVESKRVALRLETEDAGFGIDTAVPCGLIIQELVSNSLKHAFPGEQKGEINVSLRRLPGGAWKLTIADDGPGLSGGDEALHGDSLGLRLVRILTDQLSGSVRCIPGSGTRIEIEFEES